MAAYDVKTALAIDDLVEGNSIWCYSDIFEELHQFKEPFHGGYGMMTYTGIPKPVFWGMKMLAESGKRRIVLDESAFTEIEAAAFESDTEKQILLFRQNTIQSDAAPEKAEIQVELDRKPQKVYLQRIDENHCNPRKIWEKMGSPDDLTAKEVEFIKETSKMVAEEICYGYLDSILSVEVELGVNDLYFIRIVK